MAFDEALANRIREALVENPEVEEKYMFGGMCFMVKGKMCVGVVKDEMMCRVDPALQELLLEKTGCRPMDFSGKPMKGYVFVEQSALRSKKELTYWTNLCLDFNSRAKASKKKIKKK